MSEERKVQNGTPERKLDDSASTNKVTRRRFIGAAAAGATVIAATQKASGQAAGGLPPEYTAPAETLKPGTHDSELFMEATGYTEENAMVSSWIGRNVAGITIGFVQLRAVLPMIPGHPANGTTFKFPILNEKRRIIAQVICYYR